MAGELEVLKQSFQRGLSVSTRLVQDLRQVIDGLTSLQNELRLASTRSTRIPGVGQALATMQGSYEELLGQARLIARTVQTTQVSIRELSKTVTAMVQQGQKTQQRMAADQEAGPDVVSGAASSAAGY